MSTQHRTIAGQWEEHDCETLWQGIQTLASIRPLEDNNRLSAAVQAMVFGRVDLKFAAALMMQINANMMPHDKTSIILEFQEFMHLHILTMLKMIKVALSWDKIEGVWSNTAELS